MLDIWVPQKATINLALLLGMLFRLVRRENVNFDNDVTMFEVGAASRTFENVLRGGV